MLSMLFNLFPSFKEICLVLRRYDTTLAILKMTSRLEMPGMLCKV